MRLVICFLFLHCLLVLPQALSASQPEALNRVTVDIPPLKAPVERLLRGIATVDVLLSEPVSPHLFHPSPSHIRMLEDTDLMIVIGGELIPQLDEMVNAAELNGRVIPLLPLARPKLYATPHSHDDQQHSNNALDPHIWLDPTRLSDAMKALTEQLAKRYPQHAVALVANLAQTKYELLQIDSVVAERLTDIKGDVPITSQHDAYGYFAERYGLHFRAPLTHSPEELQGAADALAAHDAHADGAVACILSESDTPAVKRLAENTKAEIVMFDPVFGSLDFPGKGLSSLLETLSYVVKRCAKTN